MDIYKSHINKNASDTQLVPVGRIVAAVSLVIAVLLAPVMGNIDQMFQYIQEYTGFISPGVVAIFVLGFFWKRTSANAAMAAVILAIPFSMAFKFLLPEFPFRDRMGVCFLLIVAIMIVLILIMLIFYLMNQKKRE